MELQGAVAIVTGASSGIGAATARALAAQGARLVLAARRTDRIEALAHDLPDALAVTTDLRDPAQILRLVDATLERYGRIDILVNNAGQGLHLPLEEVSLDDFVAVTQLNTFAPLLAIQAVLPAMRRQRAGAIVNVSSGTSRMVLPGAGAYAATKAALNQISAIARRELAPDGIAVSTVFPAVVATEFHASLRAGARVGGAGGPPPIAPEDVATAIVELIRSGAEEAVLMPGGQRHGD